VAHEAALALSRRLSIQNSRKYVRQQEL